MFDSMRETMLNGIQWQGNTDRGNYTQFERLRNQADEEAKFYNIEHISQIQKFDSHSPGPENKNQYRPLKKRRNGNDHRHRGAPTKLRFVVRQITRFMAS